MRNATADVVVVGGGIAGLTTALCLHAHGLPCRVYEQAPAFRELGVGINLLPPAVGVLAELGLLESLDGAGVRTTELILATRRGQHIWRERRGLAAGHAVPQLSIHRGHLLRALHAAARERIGPRQLRAGHQVVDVASTRADATVTFAGGQPPATGAVVLGADGIHSAVRSRLIAGEGDPRWNGVMMWRGAVEWPVFLDGSSMIVAGGTSAKVVLYPIGPGRSPSTRLTNWAVVRRVAEEGTPPPQRADWSRVTRSSGMEEALAHFSIGEVDLAALVRSTPTILEYPMCDRDPLPAWTQGRVTLIGDAAHPMYPMGSNGGTQSILDAAALARHLATAGVDDALAAYEAERRPVTSAIVALNRLGGPERVIDLVEERAPDGFSRLDDVISQDELRARLTEYAQVAGLAPR